MIVMLNTVNTVNSVLVTEKFVKTAKYQIPNIKYELPNQAVLLDLDLYSLGPLSDV